MSFNVTQCPACESTFNTNSRVLAAAAGKVRCGACLNVFEAIDHFLIPEEADEASHQDESVFVGNDPQEFFDPSSFLTRSALRETHEDEPLTDDAIDEQNLHQELGRSETVDEDFFASVVEELQGRDDAPEPGAKPEPIEEATPDQAEEQLIDGGTEEIDSEFEDEIVGSFSAQAEEALQPTEENTPAFEADIAPEIEAAPPAATIAPAEDKESFLGTGLSASFSFDPHALRQKRSNAAKQATLPDQQETVEQPPERSVAGDSEAESHIAGPASSDVLVDEEVQTSQQGLLNPDAEEIVEAKSATSPQDEAMPAAEVDVDVDVEETIDEPLPIAESNAPPQPIATPAPAIHEEEPGLAAESFSNETRDVKTSGEHEPAAGESADAEDKPDVETPKSSASETEDESTEAIRARALEAELSDEDALEVIPRENLAALGSMSTPVELLARRESRLLRSRLLFLSILLLGGLLSAQYLWQRMELYSQLPQLRPLYEVACGYLDCELPVYTDIDSIRSENLTVQTHPTFANGLMVNTVIRNTAAFEQPFPILILSFNSAENNVIALREFTAAEYLDPGLRSVRSMPALTPVQIGLAIMDPGPEAVNYTLAFRWP